ncbi:MAG: class I SAM-dependent methyltransferase [Pseudomonadota bacterium]
MSHLSTSILSQPNISEVEKQLGKRSAAITATEPCLRLAAQRLASQYLLPLIKISEQESFEFILILNEQGLSLQHTREKDSSNLQINFLKGEIAYRLRHIQDQKQLLAKALGRKIHPNATVLDLTAGLGNDGFVLAQLGFSVTLLERSSIIAALLSDGLQRALHHEKYSHINIQLIHVDATLFLKKILQTKQFPEVIYLDPMYPHSNKSALVKKEMRLLREIVGNDDDAETLLPLALTCAQRVVVKRPRLAPFLAKLKPHHSIAGKQHRFDIYLNR